MGNSMNQSMEDKVWHVQETVNGSVSWKVAVGEGKIMCLERLFRAGLSPRVTLSWRQWEALESF